MVLKSIRHNVSSGNTVRSKWAHNKNDFHPVIRKSVLGDGGDCHGGDMFDISDGYVRCNGDYFLDDGCLEAGPSVQATLLYSLNKRGRWKIPSLLAKVPTRATTRTGHRDSVDENMTSKAHHFLTKQVSFYQCFSVKPDGSTSGFNADLIEKDRQVLLKATRARNVVLSRRKDHKKRVPIEVNEDSMMTLPLVRAGQKPEVQYDVCLTCPYSVMPVDLEEDRSCRHVPTTNRKLKYSHTSALSQFREYMDGEDDMMEDVLDWAIYDSLNDSLSSHNPQSCNDVNGNDFIKLNSNDLQAADETVEVIENENDLGNGGEPDATGRRGTVLSDWVTKPRKQGKRGKCKVCVEDGWEIVDKDELCNPQDWEVVPDHCRM